MVSLLLIQSEKHMKATCHFATMATGGANGIFFLLLFKWTNIAPFALRRKEHDICGECNSKADFPSACWYFLIKKKTVIGL